MNAETTVCTAQWSDIDELGAALVPEVSSHQIDNRWQEHMVWYRQMLVAEVDGNVVGTVSTVGHRFRVSGSLRMFTLDVGQASRGQGIGTALINAVEQRARLDGFACVNLEVAVDNSGAIRLYERLGFVGCGPPVVDRWTRLTEEGEAEAIEDASWAMVKCVDRRL